MDEIKLKECPFCGRDAHIVAKKDKVYVECKWCGCRTGDWTTLLGECATYYAITFWNTRKRIKNKIFFG